MANPDGGDVKIANPQALPPKYSIFVGPTGSPGDSGESLVTDVRGDSDNCQV